MSFAEEKSAGKKRVTKRRRFLGEMGKVVPWRRLLLVIKPYCPKGERGRPLIGLERMLHIYFLQQWYGLSDEGLEDVLCTTALRYALSLVLIWPLRTCRMQRRC